MTNEITVDEAIELLKDKRMEINYKVNGTTQFSKVLDMAIEALEVADKKPGKWKTRSIDGPGRSLMVYKCSECKKFALYMTDYCPSCGAKMEWRRPNEKIKK